MIKISQIFKWIRPNAKNLVWLFCAIVFIIGFIKLVNRYHRQKAIKAEYSRNLSLADKPIYNPFSLIELNAKAAIVLDTKDQEAIFEKNADFGLPLASITKIMTAVTSYQSKGDETKITINQNDLDTEGKSGLELGEVWKMNDLIDFMLTVSSNDAAASLARINVGKNTIDYQTSFARQMNEQAVKLGLTNSFFFNPTGLDQTKFLAGAYASAREVALMLEQTIEKFPRVVAFTKEGRGKITSLSGIVHEVKNTNKLTNKIEGLIASKTGFTDLAGGNLVIAYQTTTGNTIIISVLGSTEQGRFDDVYRLYKASSEYLKMNLDIKSTASCLEVRK